MNGLGAWKRTDLLKLPDYVYADIHDEGRYWDALLFVFAHSKHESGWANFAVIGVEKEVAVARLTTYDVLNLWDPNASPYWSIDCVWPSGAFRLFRSGHEVTVDRWGGSVRTRRREAVAS